MSPAGPLMNRRIGLAWRGVRGAGKREKYSKNKEN